MWIVAGDLLTLIVVTAIGFAAHGEADLSFLPRFAAILVPLVASWLIVAAAMRLFQPAALRDPKRLWQVPVAACLACLPAAILRGLILSEPVAPAFMLVLAATTALGLTIWRAVHAIFRQPPR